MSATPYVELCPTAAHLRECGECAEEIESIVKNALQSIALPEAAPLDEVVVDEDGTRLSGLVTSHANVPNGQDHPVEYADQCGICLAAKRKVGERPTTPAAILTQLERSL